MTRTNVPASPRSPMSPAQSVTTPRSAATPTTPSSAASRSSRASGHSRLTPRSPALLPYNCGKCDQQFRYKHLLLSHMEMHKEKNQLKKCGLCGVHLQADESLVQHINEVHISDEMPVIRCKNKSHRCGICFEQARTGVELNIHMLSHSGSRQLASPLRDLKCSSPKIVVPHLKKNDGDVTRAQTSPAFSDRNYSRL